jgi:energy-coupling factor transporter ATP-binding protein EcfA2
MREVPPEGLYVEFVGSSGVGKTTLRDALARALPGYRTFFPSKRTVRHLPAFVRRPKRIVALARLASYLARERGMPPRAALAIAAYVVLTPLAAAPGRAVLVDEGPCGYLLARGGHGLRWAAFTSILRPDVGRARDVFVFLDASPETIEARRVKRGRAPKVRRTPTGKEATTPQERSLAREDWFARLSQAGATCVALDAEHATADELAMTLLTELRSRGVLP